MPTKSWPALALLMLTAFFLVGAASRINTSGQLEISPEIDLGELTHNQELSLAIGFRNGGNGRLQLSPPIPACDCAAAEIDRLDYAPGESGSFRFVLRPANLPGLPYEQSIVVPSTDSDSPRTIVKVRGRMRDTLVSRPAAIRVGEVQAGEKWNRQFTIHCSDSSARVRVISAQSNNPLFAVQVVQRAGPPTLELLPNVILPVGKTVGQVTIQTDHPKLTEIVVPVEAIVESGLSVQPRQLLFDAASSSDSQRVIITAKSPVELSATTSASDLFVTTLVPNDSKLEWVVIVQLAPDAMMDKTTRHLLELRVDGLEYEDRVEIPVAIVTSNVGASAEVRQSE